MSVICDKTIRNLSDPTLPNPLLAPFSEGKQGDFVISYGLTSAGYDLRLGYKYLAFTNPTNTIVCPKLMKLDPEYRKRFLVEITRDGFGVALNYGSQIIVPGHSYILGYSLEYIRVPGRLKGRCVGKCLSGNTRVLNPTTGEYKRIDEYQPKDEVACVSFGKGPKANLIGRSPTRSGRIDNGREVVRRITLKSGVSVQATPSHKFMGVSGWTPMHDLKVGDRVMVPGHLPFFGNGQTAWAEVKLLALMIADGQCAATTPMYSKQDPRLVKMLKWATRTLLGCEVTSSRDHHYRIVNHIGTGGDYTVRNKLAVLLESHGVACNSRDKRIPDAVFLLPKEKLATFLRVLFSGDGSVYLANKNRKTPNVVVEYSSASRRMIEDIHHLMLRFGVRGTIRSKEVKGDTYHSYFVRRKSDLARFFRHVGFVEGCFKDTFYKEAVARYVEAAERPEATVFDEITSISEGIVLPVYDLEVPVAHNFVANDIVVHNSTYARCGLIVNTTPLEPGWHGHLTIEIANASPCPVAIYAGEGIAQLEFDTLDHPPETNYADKAGKYQGQGPEPIPATVK